MSRRRKPLPKLSVVARFENGYEHRESLAANLLKQHAQAVRDLDRAEWLRKNLPDDLTEKWTLLNEANELECAANAIIKRLTDQINEIAAYAAQQDHRNQKTSEACSRSGDITRKDIEIAHAKAAEKLGRRPTSSEILKHWPHPNPPILRHIQQLRKERNENLETAHAIATKKLGRRPTDAEILKHWPDDGHPPPVDYIQLLRKELDLT
ncbi:MAG TPA: hypothetical protein VLC91_01820 [Spongiibacteraceae bacterium]|nr:hypothetical protein [Spongiibacteraceae bacterium]